MHRSQESASAKCGCVFAELLTNHREQSQAKPGRGSRRVPLTFLVCSLAGGFELIARFPFDRWLCDGEPPQLDAKTA
jgi:hypothetical protein